MRRVLAAGSALVLAAAAAAPLSAGGAAGTIGTVGGPSRSFLSFHGRLPGERTSSILRLVATGHGVERVLWTPRDRTQDWVQIVDDPAEARFLLRRGLRGVHEDRDAYAFFGVRDDEDLESFVPAIPGSISTDERGQLYAPTAVAAPSRRAGAGLRDRETWFGTIARALLAGDFRRDAAAARDFGVRLVGARSTAVRTGRGEWTLTAIVENRTGTDYDFAWPSVLTDEGLPWEGTVAAGGTAVLSRVVDARPRIVAGAVGLTPPGGVHPDFLGPAEHYAPR